MKGRLKMKSYLNKEERETLLKVALTSGYIEDLAKLNLDIQNEIKYFKMAFTFLNKAFKHLLNRLDAKFAAQLNREINSSELMLVSNSRAKMDLEEKALSQEMFDAIVDQALGGCANCQEKDKRKCRLKKAFKAYNIPPCDGNNSECPYELI